MDAKNDILKKYYFNSNRNDRKNFKLLLKKYCYFNSSFKVINIVGTNGKGSTSYYLSKQLKNSYKKVGLFLSPALLKHNERIQINNKAISDFDIFKYLDFFSQDLLKFKLNFFEIWTLIAMKYFSDLKIDIAVIEAGIGGYFDATRLFLNQIVIGLTAVGFDHVNILGNNIKSIIANKIGIRKDENLFLFSAFSNFKYKKLLLLYKNVFFAKPYKKAKIFFQKDNIGLVIKILLFLNLKIDYKIFKTDSLFGRFTILKKNKFLILDGAHNLNAINNLIKTVKLFKIKKPLFLLSCTYNKDYINMIKTINDQFEIYLVNFNYYKMWNLKNVNFNENKKIYDLKKLKLFLDQNKKRNIIVTGSLYFISAFFDWWTANKS